ncbi:MULTISPECIES: hypothetical protein [unclassified Moorena]|uniref:hypothetical protein n=1 Tax=unclassified Moorena TaxID=2683338 RepID=UPI0013B8C7E3|nr:MULTISPECIES: hypothetical protein [unclassified Moorena]NEP35323.1 hypothetical protein [Moorena sp. SIO3B2]NEQ08027.1 hypothetical protein [Moorena sp. SIO4E2]NER90887.1 hypothetical protein [Moorena sp. SIO3A2]NET68503.1 hypothetical protein [Moorena sp. SIO1G6]
MKAENYLFLSAFKQLLDTKTELFKDSERTDLEELITSLPSDTEQLANGISRWCASHSDINNALIALLASKTIDKKGIGGTFPTDETKAEEEKNLKETLINALRKSSTEETEKPKNPKG